MHETEIEDNGTETGLARIVYLTEIAWRAVSAVFMFAIMVIIVVDVVSRYLLNSPLPWAFDVVSMYLMVGLFFLMLSDTFRADGHVRVDILYAKAPPRLMRLMDLISSALALLVFGAITLTSASTTWNSWSAGDVLAGSILWPVWLSYVFIPLGVALLVARIIVDTLINITQLAADWGSED